jgi:hypothetical protein
LSTRRELAGDADRGAHRVGLAREVVAGDAELAAVGAISVERICTDRRLAGAVGPEQREHVPSATSRSTPSSTTWSPKDLRSPVP